jgi:hypothetical protein
MRNAALCLWLCIAGLGCQSGLEFLQSFQPTHFLSGPDPVAQSMVETSGLREGMSLTSAEQLLAKQGFSRSCTGTKSGESFVDYCQPNRSEGDNLGLDFVQNVRLFYQEDQLVRHEVTLQFGPLSISPAE